MSLRLMARQKAWNFIWGFFCLIAKQQDYPLRQVMNQEKTLETIYTKRIQELFCCYLDTLLKTEWQRQG